MDVFEVTVSVFSLCVCVCVCVCAYYKQRFLSCYFLMEETKKISDTLKFHSELIKIVVRDCTIAWFQKESLIYKRLPNAYSTKMNSGAELVMQF